MSVSITADHIVKKYGDITIIPDLNIRIQNGELFTLLGPSGCGKTTFLRMIAGFNSIEEGTIAFNEQVINDIPPQKRNVGMVFQNYAIFPHLTVRQNVEYGLKLRGIKGEEMKRRVGQALETTQITQYADRLPDRLSGGQQQRVALARAIVIEPEVLLMDEPLSNLDAKLRVEMRTAIRTLQKSIGTTAVYVTHDQEEALAISDRIAVMNHGEIQQIADPSRLYARPYNVFVSTFLGSSNLFYAKVDKSGGTPALVFNNGYRLPVETLVDSVEDGQRVVVSIRPEEFRAGETGLDAEIVHSTFLGKYMQYFLTIDDAMVLPDQPSLEFSQDLGYELMHYRDGDHLKLMPNAEKINVFTEDGAMSLIRGVERIHA